MHFIFTNLSNFSHLLLVLFMAGVFISCQERNTRIVEDFNWNWKFQLEDDSLAFSSNYDDEGWRTLHLPHDWSIEGKFSEAHATGQAGGALPAGKGWYRKSFNLSEKDKDRKIYINFGGVYRNSEVWINDEYLGKRPFGYISFRYDLTPYLHFGEEQNVIVVKVDNTPQPNSRWYTGSGIYRNVKLIKTRQVHVAQWGTFVTSPFIRSDEAEVVMEVEVTGLSDVEEGKVVTELFDESDNKVAETSSALAPQLQQKFTVLNPALWSVADPAMYLAVTKVYVSDKLMDRYETPFAIRHFNFDSDKGFFLNGKPLKIYGVNQHHDLGALGAAFNERAAERQLEILKEMGCNAIRMAHNPPAEELLDLCDRMGFLVIDESFDVWAKRKAKMDYHLVWDEWHKRDLKDMVLRDRNHPSIVAWSIGNEIREQFDSTGITITRELAEIVRSLDTTRMITSGLTENIPEKNFITQSGALDLLGFNYKQEAYLDLPNRFPGIPLLASETSSALATRGHYDMPSDSVQRWPPAYNQPIPNPNPDLTASAYDMISAYWGSTHEETWRVVKKLDHMAGIFIWSGFDYLGEPLPYPYPARSSYFGVIDLAGFPKDSYYMYQSEWTKEPMLHVFPHWNWKPGQTVDVWTYYNQADEVELFLNGNSYGVKRKEGEDLHVMWRLSYAPGTVRVVSRKDGQEVRSQELRTTGGSAKIALKADRGTIQADGYDLSFIEVNVLDKEGNLVPLADNLIAFEISGPGRIVGTDNGYQASLESFKSNQRKAWKGKCLVIVQSKREESGQIKLTAKADELTQQEMTILSK